MNGPRRARWLRSAWTWPALLGAGSVFALVTALVTDGNMGWALVCWLLLLLPLGWIARALWPGRAAR